MDILGRSCPQGAGLGLGCGAKTIPATRPVAARFLALATMAALVGACASPEPNVIQRGAIDRETERLQRVREELRREQMALTLAIAEDREALQRLLDSAADVAQRCRDARRGLDRENAALVELQAKVAAVKDRAVAAAAELDSMRALLAEAQTKELRWKALQEQIVQLDAQVSAAQRDADTKSAALLPQLQALQERVKALAAIEAQLAALLQPSSAADGAPVPQAAQTDATQTQPGGK
jgi:chromosome segregation ATPase